MFCDCARPIVDPDDLRCALCGKTTAAALSQPKVIAIDPLDALLQHRRRVAYIAASN